MLSDMCLVVHPMYIVAQGHMSEQTNENAESATFYYSLTDTTEHDSKSACLKCDIDSAN